MDFPVHLVADRLKKAEARSVQEVEPGQGKLVDVNGTRLAIYRDEAGRVHAVDPVCTHLKRLVEFNDAEKSWDCPCHGSRFDTEGNVINRPAVKDLAPVAWNAAD